MVLNRVVGPARQQPGNGGPPVPVLGVGRQYRLVFGLRKGPVLDVRAQLVAPPEPARLPRPALYVLADQRPVSGPVPVHEPGQDLVLLGAPRPFYLVAPVVSS